VLSHHTHHHCDGRQTSSSETAALRLRRCHHA
jgi:hypothetical protein